MLNRLVGKVGDFLYLNAEGRDFFFFALVGFLALCLIDTALDRKNVQR